MPKRILFTIRFIPITITIIIGKLKLSQKSNLSPSIITRIILILFGLILFANVRTVLY